MDVGDRGGRVAVGVLCVVLAGCETVSLRAPAPDEPAEETAAPSAAPAAPSARATALSVGSRSSCAIVEERALWCWGSGGGGMLGESAGPGPIRVASEPEMSAVSVGPDRVCFVAAGRPKCFGRMSGRAALVQEGYHGPLVMQTAPAEVRGGLEAVTDVTVGLDQTCFISGGEVRCLGSDESGAGRGARSSRLGDVMARDAIDVAAGLFHTCAAKRDGGVACWGAGSAGQMAAARVRGFTYDPRPIPDLEGVRQIATARNGALTCALADRIHCWGSAGDVRDESRMALDEALIELPEADEPIARIAVGLLGVYAIGESGALHRYGVGERVPVEGGRYETSFREPEQVETAPLVDVGVGLAHTCALDREGAVRCWGLPIGGRLGGTDDAGARVSAADAVVVRFEESS